MTGRESGGGWAARGKWALLKCDLVSGVNLGYTAGAS
jgi:hypothetical protein